MTRITFEHDGVEGEINVDERSFTFGSEGDEVLRLSVHAELNKKRIVTGPSETHPDSFVSTQKRVPRENEEVIEALKSLFGLMDVEYEVHDREEKTVCKSLWTDYVHREHKLRREAKDVPVECEQCVRDAFEEQIWPDDLSKSPSWESDDDVTQQTQEWVDAVFQLRDPLYDSYDDIPQAAALSVKSVIRESLTQEQGWSLDSVVSRLEDEFDVLSRGRAKRIARQEIAATLNQAEKISFQARPDEPEVVWNGPSDSSTTELCEEVKREVGDGVPLSELEDILERKARKYKYGTPERVDQLVPHWQCRHEIDES